MSAASNSTSAKLAHDFVVAFAALVTLVSACSTDEAGPDLSSDMLDIADDTETSNNDSTSDADVDPCADVTFESHADTCSKLYDTCRVRYPSCSGECTCYTGDASGRLVWRCQSNCEPEEDFFVPDGTSD